MDAWATKGAPDHVWFEDIFPAMATLKSSFAALAGCDPDEVAITTNVSVALSTIASALDLSGARNRIVMSELDFPTDGHVWLAWARKSGAEIVWLRSPDGLTIPLEAYDAAIDERTAVVMVNRVLYRSSASWTRRPSAPWPAQRGALSFVDDYHGIGIVPLDLHALGCDLYTAGTLKWLCGGPGVVFLYARRDLLPTLEPAVTGWFATAEPFSFDNQHLTYHPTARRLEHGTPPAPVFFIAQGGLDIIAEVGVDRIRERQGELTDHVIARADAMGLPVRTPRDRDGARRSRERRCGPRRGDALPRAAGPRRLHGLPRRRTADQPAFLQHRSRHRPLLRRARRPALIGRLRSEHHGTRSNDQSDVVEGAEVLEGSLVEHDEVRGRPRLERRAHERPKHLVDARGLRRASSSSSWVSMPAGMGPLPRSVP